MSEEKKHWDPPNNYSILCPLVVGMFCEESNPTWRTLQKGPSEALQDQKSKDAVKRLARSFLGDESLRKLGIGNKEAHELGAYGIFWHVNRIKGDQNYLSNDELSTLNSIFEDLRKFFETIEKAIEEDRFGNLPQETWKLLEGVEQMKKLLKEGFERENVFNGPLKQYA